MSVELSSDPFAYFNMQSSYMIDMDQLQQAYLKAQQACHPDSFVGQGEEVQLEARNKSAAVNDAYQTLKDPVARAAAMMRRMGIEVPGEGDSTVQDPQALMEIMELREQLAGLESPQKLSEFIDSANAQFMQLQEQMAAALDAGSGNGKAAQVAYLNLNYYAKLLASARKQYQQLSVKIR